MHTVATIQRKRQRDENEEMGVKCRIERNFGQGAVSGAQRICEGFCIQSVATVSRKLDYLPRISEQNRIEQGAGHLETFSTAHLLSSLEYS